MLWLSLYCCGGRCRAPLPEEELLGQFILLSEEHIPGALIARNLQAPGKRPLSYQNRRIYGAVAVTANMLLIYQGPFSRPIIRIPWVDKRWEQVKISIDSSEDDKVSMKSTLVISWQAALFQPRWSGQMQLRLQLDQPELFMKEICRQVSKVRED